MAIRTTEALVKEVMLPNKDYDTENAPSLTIPIRAANSLTDRINECATNKGITYTDQQLADLETYLAAFFYQMSDKGYLSRTTARASGTFHGKWKELLYSNNYGQSALVLDYSGCLRAMQNRGNIMWLGKVKDDQIDYVDRT